MIKTAEDWWDRFDLSWPVVELTLRAVLNMREFYKDTYQNLNGRNLAQEIKIMRQEKRGKDIVQLLQRAWLSRSYDDTVGMKHIQELCRSGYKVLP